MSNIQFRSKITRKVFVDPSLTKGKTIMVGEVEEHQKTDDELFVNIRLDDNLPEQMRLAIEKNPSCLRLAEIFSTPSDVMIIPSRPKIITPP